jgi:small-conductance mechanosensitive channel
LRFLLVKDLKKDKNFKAPLSVLLIFTTLYLIADIFVKHSTLGLFPSTVVSSLFGDEEQYIEPMELSVFLEFWHMEIFIYMMILLTLSAVFIRVFENSKTSVTISHINMILAFVSLVSIALAYFYTPALVYLYSGSFLLWHILSLYICIVSLYRIYHA